MAIAVRNRIFKKKWVTSDLIIEVQKTSHHRILASSTAPGHTENQEAYIIKLS